MPKPSPCRILLTGVFGPFAQDDEYGSRRVNPMELYHNQVTRVQGPFSLRMFHRTFGLLMIEANIDAPCTILDFPTLDRFTREIEKGDYDVVGISAIVPNILKVKKMCQEIRRRSPRTVIVVGGHIANKADLAERIDTDHICKGDGIRWFREYLGQDTEAPILHPAAVSGFNARILGLPVSGKNTAGILIPSVGCPVGCNFCSTSTLFGGKGHCVNFHETGDELFSICLHLEKTLKVSSFFVLDENFLLYKKRALRLLELMEQHGKSWAFFIFSSARVLRSYSMEQLVRLGVSWVWLGLEGQGSKYTKLNGVDTKALVAEFRRHGIRVLGSTIIGMEEHTPENIDAAIAYAVEHDTDFHQFMLYTPMPGTPLHREHLENGTLLSDAECDPADVHGQERFNYRHQHIRDGQEKEYLLRAFREDFRVNGPSLARIVRTTLEGYERYRNHPDQRIAKRFRNGIRGFASAYAGALWAMTRWYRGDPAMLGKTEALLQKLYAEFGLKARVLAPLFGTLMKFTMRREAKRLENGWTYEPPVICQKNALAKELEKKQTARLRLRHKAQPHPGYDVAKVLASYGSRLEDARQSLSEIRCRAMKQIALVDERLRTTAGRIRAQMVQSSTDIRQTRDQVGEQLREMYEVFLVQCEKDRAEITMIREQTAARCEALREQISRAQDFALRKFTTAQKQLGVMADQLSERYDLTVGQITQAVEDSLDRIRDNSANLKRLLSAGD